VKRILLNSILVSAFIALTAMAVDARACEYTVATDGSGQFKSVQAAVDKVPANNKTRCTIRIKPGTYIEQVRVPADKPYVSFIGENAETTKLTYKISNKDAGSTSAAYATYIGGHDFHAENIAFENSFGTGSQAVAILVEADRAVFRNCRFLGWQDTLYAKNGRQYYKDSYIEGHVDFIFGQAAAVFENCRIHSKADGYIAAPMRFAADEPSGFVFLNSTLTSENTEKGIYLGRPWRDYGRTVFINTKMDAAIRPEGWHHWEPQREKTAYLAEYGSTGKGANPDSRVTWARKLGDPDVKQFTVEHFLGGRDGWDPTHRGDAWIEKTPPDFKLVSWADVLKQPKLWYAVDEATRIANQVILYQRDNGGWEKNVDMAAMLTQAERQKLIDERSKPNTTIDNGATTTQLAYLAKVITAKNIEAHKTAFNKGLDFLLAMQYVNGGFPQYFPLRKDYSRHITFNDNAMISVLRLLRDVAKKKEDFLFVDAERRLKAERAVELAIPVLLKTQVEVGGKKTVWAAQYDETTLKPAAARTFEPISLTAGESVGIVKFLMLDVSPSDEVKSAIEAAIAWFEMNKLTGIRWGRSGGENRVVKDPSAKPIWARFYEIPSMKPIFIGRDGVIKYDVIRIEPERRNGYAWYVEAPRDLIVEDYPKWKQKISAANKN
jgi:PelA/Pel-15E family pectate lyase